MELSPPREPVASVASSDQSRLLKELATPLFAAKRWMKLVGILLIVQGILSVFSLLGILFAWLPIWMGWLLLKSSKDVELAEQRGDKAALMHGMNQLKTFFTINGIITLAMLILFTVLMLVFGGTMLSMLDGMKELLETQQMMPPGP